MSGRRVAIDYGTSFTVVAAQDTANAPLELVRLGDEYRLPSAVGLTERDEVQAGSIVEEIGARFPTRVERAPKLSLANEEVLLDGHLVATAELVAAVLSFVRDEVRRRFNGRDAEEVWLTHPARWEVGDPRWLRLERGARLAGFAAVKSMPEPCAAACALSAMGHLTDVGEGDLVAVYDLGGGTFDTALLIKTGGDEGFTRYGEPGGDAELGGERLDDLLFERLTAQLPGADEQALRDPDNAADPFRWRRAGYAFRGAIRRSKERLSRETIVEIPLAPPFGLDHLVLSRVDVEQVAVPLIAKSADQLEVSLRRNGRSADELAAICLVGGSSRLTVVNRVLGERFQRPLATHGDPKALTALGVLRAHPAVRESSKEADGANRETMAHDEVPNESYIDHAAGAPNVAARPALPIPAPVSKKPRRFLRRSKYGEAHTPGEGWLPTQEVSFDPKGYKVRVWVDPTGTRHYVPE